MLAICLDPKSRGSVRIKKKRIDGGSKSGSNEEEEDYLAIDPEYLEKPKDMECMKRGKRK